MGQGSRALETTEGGTLCKEQNGEQPSQGNGCLPLPSACLCTRAGAVVWSRAWLWACILCPLLRIWDVGKPREWYHLPGLWKDRSWQHKGRLGCREQGFGVELSCWVPNYPMFPSVCAAPFSSWVQCFNNAGNAGTAGLRWSGSGESRNRHCLYILFLCILRALSNLQPWLLP